MNDARQALIFGATGNMGGAATRVLLQRGWRVRTVTREPASAKAQALARLGADVVRANMDDRRSLEAACDGIRRVFSVQNWVEGGPEGEIRQGKLVADVAHAAGVEHLVYGSAGTGEPDTGIPHFESKLVVEAYMRRLGIPFTTIRPTPFMELLSEQAFYPAVGAWGMKPRVIGWHTPTPWIAVHDIGVAIANALEDPDRWLGQDVTLIGDVRSLAECRAVFERVDGRRPARIPLPRWLFSRLAGEEFLLMWRWLVAWLASEGVEALATLAASSRALCPNALDLESWLRMKRQGLRTRSLQRTADPAVDTAASPPAA